MNREQIFKNIQQLIPILQAYHAKGSATISIEQKMLIKETYPRIYSVPNMNVACEQCCLSYITMLCAWYEREYPLYLQSQLNVSAEIKSNKKKKP